MTPKELLEALPDYLDDLEQATNLSDEIKRKHDELIKQCQGRRYVTPDEETFWEQTIENINTCGAIYESYREAFEDNYSGDTDEWRRDTCEDYQYSISNFTDYYIDWLVDNKSICCELARNKILIVD